MNLREMASAYLTDADLLAVLLQGPGSRANALPKAQALLKTFGSLRKVMEADSQALGLATHAKLNAAFELVRRVMEETLRRDDAMACPTDTCRYLAARLRHEPHEVFACLFLDSRHRVIAFEDLFHGTIDGASVHPRQVVKRALSHNAAALILAHNHPSGIAEPSEADKRITRKIQDALAWVDVRVLDHVVIGDGQAVSFLERGWL